VQADLSSLDPREWRRNLLAFLGWSPRLENQLTVESLEPVLTEAREVLRRIARECGSGVRNAQMPKRFIIGDVTAQEAFSPLLRSPRAAVFRVDSSLIAVDLSRPNNLGPILCGNVRAAFIVALLTTLSRSNVAYLRQCRSSSCARIFFARDIRKVFCSRKCASRETTRHYREAHREKERGRAEETYKEKMREKLGQNVQIRRNERRTQPKEAERAQQKAREPGRSKYED